MSSISSAGDGGILGGESSFALPSLSSPLDITPHQHATELTMVTNSERTISTIGNNNRRGDNCGIIGGLLKASIGWKKRKRSSAMGRRTVRWVDQKKSNIIGSFSSSSFSNRRMLTEVREFVKDTNEYGNI